MEGPGQGQMAAPPGRPRRPRWPRRRYAPASPRGESRHSPGNVPRAGFGPPSRREAVAGLRRRMSGSMHLAWLTDIHLNFLEDDARRDFAAAVAATGADGVVVTGDIAEAESLVPMLEELAEVVARPVWFVLGNHDFYGSG